MNPTYSTAPVRRSSLLPMFGVIAAVIVGLALLFVTAPEPIAKDRFLVIPLGWLRFLIGFVLVAGGAGACAYLWGKATRPGKANAYAVAMATHIFLWVVVLLTFYPIVYLLTVSFNRNNNLAAALPREGNVLVRSGVLPDAADFSLVQYREVLSQTHILGYQWIFIAIAALAILGIIAVNIAKRSGLNPLQVESWTQRFGWTIFLSLAVLIVTIGPSQFYNVNASGERVPAGSERMIILYIRNTLLVSGITGLFAVLISTTAGYAFARFRFEGRYSTLITFVFVQMFPGFMALVAIYYLMSYLDLLNTFPGLILAYSGGAIAFASWIFKGYLESISPSLEEAALVDGTTRWGAFWRIILPISVPMLLFIFLLQFIGTYSEFILANTLLQDNTKWTVGMGLRNFTAGQFATQWGLLAASAVLGSIPILAIFYSFQGALTGQYTAGGVKG
jgi:arabinogalactan oligomer / maltooligosaccharide transport system permease protein